jgi:hypothetical protein
MLLKLISGGRGERPQPMLIGGKGEIQSSRPALIRSSTCNGTSILPPTLLPSLESFHIVLSPRVSLSSG